MPDLKVQLLEFIQSTVWVQILAISRNPVLNAARQYRNDSSSVDNNEFDIGVLTGG